MVLTDPREVVPGTGRSLPADIRGDSVQLEKRGYLLHMEPKAIFIDHQTRAEVQARHAQVVHEAVAVLRDASRRRDRQEQLGEFVGHGPILLFHFILDSQSCFYVKTFFLVHVLICIFNETRSPWYIDLELHILMILT